MQPRRTQGYMRAWHAGRRQRITQTQHIKGTIEISNRTTRRSITAQGFGMHARRIEDGGAPQSK
jgi:hypothetical protein